VHHQMQLQVTVANGFCNALFLQPLSHTVRYIIMRTVYTAAAVQTYCVRMVLPAQFRTAAAAVHV
jgi:hypothetical protein